MPTSIIEDTHHSTGYVAPTVASIGSGCVTGGLSCNFSATLTAGHLVVVAAVDTPAATLSFTISGSGNTCTVAGTAYSYTAVGSINAGICPITTGGAQTITCTSSSSTDHVVCGAMDITKNSLSGIVDAFVGNSDSSAGGTCTAGASGTLLSANEIVLGFCGEVTNNFINAWSAGGSFTILRGTGSAASASIDDNTTVSSAITALGVEYQIVTSNSTITPVFTYSLADQNLVALTVTLK
jgi:hypothetical protein